MPALSNIRVETVCEKNRHLLEGFESHELINGEGFIDLSSLELDEQKRIIKEIIKNEESNVIASKENYRKLNYKAKIINQVLTITLALFVAGLTLAPLFITSSIILPVLPVLFFGVAIIAITNLFLNRKINQLAINKDDADKVSKQVKVLNQLTEVNEDDDEISNDFNRKIREVKNATIAISNKIDALAANNTRSFSELLANQGTFLKTIPSATSMPDDPANELHNTESTLNITHS